MGWAARANPRAQAVKRGEIKAPIKVDPFNPRRGKRRDATPLPLLASILLSFGMDVQRVPKFLR